MKKVILIIIFAIIAIFTLSILFLCKTSNQKGEPTMIEIDQGTIMYTRNTEKHKYSRLELFLHSNNSMSDFCQEFEIKEYKQAGEGKYIVLQTDCGLAIVCFDDNGNNGNIRKITFSNEQNIYGMEELEIGSTLEMVKSIDPDGEYPFLFHSWSGYPQISFHYFSSGVCYEILYNEGKVIDIYRFTL